MRGLRRRFAMPGSRLRLCEACWAQVRNPLPGARLGEQTGLGFGEDATGLTTRLSLERTPSVFFGRTGRSWASHRPRARMGRPVSAKTGRICWKRGVQRDRLRCRPRGELLGETEESLACDPQVIGLLVEFTQPCGQVFDTGLHLPDALSRRASPSTRVTPRKPGGVRSRGPGGGARPGCRWSALLPTAWAGERNPSRRGMTSLRSARR